MDEQQTAERLKQNLPTTLPVAPVAPTITTDEQSSLELDPVNELTMLKLANYLGLEFTNAESTQRLAFIYEQLKGDSYEKTLLNVEDALIRLGLKFAPDRFMRLWLWLRLNREKQVIETEMQNV